MGPNPECYQREVAERVDRFLAAGKEERSGSGRMHRHAITHDGIVREFFVHVPENNPPGRELPVVFALHGYGTTATGFEAIYDLNRHADRHGYIIVYPQGTHFKGALGDDPSAEPTLVTSWNDLVSNYTPAPSGGPHCTEDRLSYPCPPECGSCNHCAWVSCHDDAGFLSRVFDAVERAYPVDAERYYLLGNSNGAMMAMRLACDMPERFAAVAALLAQMPPGYECAPARSVPLMHLYGEHDDVNGHDGTPTSDGWIFASAESTAARWSAGLGCAEAPNDWHSEISDSHGLRCRAFSDCREPGHQVLSCMDTGAAHEWRGQRRSEIPANCVSPEQRASLPNQPICPQGGTGARLWGMDFVWEFFSQYRRSSKN